MPRKVLIVGNGIAGITAARHVRKRSDHEIVVVSDETDHFYSRTALMYVFMGHMRYADIKPYADDFWLRNRIDLLRGRVAHVDPAAKRVRLAGGSTLEWDSLVLATGSVSRTHDWPGHDLDGVQALYGMPDLERLERSCAGVERAAVVGGGLIGVEMAEMLRSRGIAVTFLVREKSWMDFAFPDEESRILEAEIRRHGVDLRTGTELERILPDANGRVRAIVTTSGEEIPCTLVARTIGVRPNVSLLDGSDIECDSGVLADEYLRTSAEDVWAAGDCVQLRHPPPGRRAIEPVWYAGRAMGETLARTLTGEPTRYDPGLWFNSAKFFDIEWQVYGNAPPRTPEGEASLFWRDADGRRSIRVRYRTSDRAVTGFHLLGVRYRHELCDRWIAAGTPIENVLADLAAANFDPELTPQPERDLIAAWLREHPDRPVRQRLRRGLPGALAVLRRVAGRGEA